ncbi:MAG: restriction endonuclease subunit S [Treponema sp.]|nr:restriction endonuclease subunit S [Treponema sp.]
MKLPDGWKQTKLSEIGTFSKGSGIKREESNSGCIPAVRYGEIYTDHDEYIKQFHSFISESVAKEAVLLKKGDLLFSCSGETKEDIGKCVAFVSDVSAYAGGDIIILSPHVECDSQYLGFLLNSYEINKQRYRYAQGDSIVHISSESLGKLQVALPPLPEQQKIARILSAQDKVISLKQKLLQEKQRQKKYLMRKLLSQDCASFTLCGTTIDKRGWKKEKIQNLCTISSGSTPKRDNHDNFIGSIPWLTSGELKHKYISDTIEKISEQAVSSSNLRIYEEGTVVIAIYGLEAAGVRGTCSILSEKTTISQACMAFTDFTKISNEYFYYWYMLNGQSIGIKYAQGTKQQNLSVDLIGNLSISIPSLPEQHAIAQVLSAADKEIELLQKSIEQEKQKKKALMQLLLTGTVRVKI